MNFRSFIITAFLISSFIVVSTVAVAAEMWVKESTAVFIFYRGSSQLDVISMRSAERISGTFYRLGRFMPADPRSLKRVHERGLTISDDGEAVDIYRRAAEALGLEFYVVVDTVFDGIKFISTATIIKLSDNVRIPSGRIQVESRLPANIPPKFAAEIAGLHKNIPVDAAIDCSDESCLLYAGQWHGLTPGIFSSSRGVLEITATDRFFSRTAPLDEDSERDDISIKTYPDCDNIISGSFSEIEANTINRYKMRDDASGTAEQKFVESLCVINPGAGLCLPVYGSFLSLEYAGLPDREPSMSGLVLGAVFFTSQIMAVPVATSFDGNFFPWNRDSDKSDSLADLHVYLWAAIPLTFSAVYLDQLASRLKKVEKLPPFFEDRDTTAAVMSFFIPGGGFFYKGRRELGWMAFISETGLAGLAVYNRNEGEKFKWSVAGLIALKGISTGVSWFIDPGYDVFTRETGQAETEFSFSLRHDMHQGDIYDIGMSLNF